jgi:sulfhydrogenase subunit delta
MAPKPKVAVYKFASCDGCQLSVLSLEDELLALAEQVEFAYFLEATSRIAPGPYDLSLVEGSITTAHDAERIQEVRRQAKVLVTIGACATAGGVQALRNYADVAEFTRAVYARPDYVETLATSTPIAAHVKVDHELRGCPISKRDLLALLADVIGGITPRSERRSVCNECKIAGATCVLVARGVPCLGPVTQAGCGALCPRFTRGCYGCFGPVEGANVASLGHALGAVGASPETVARLYSTFNVAAPEFRAAAERELVKLRVPAKAAS